MIRKASPETDQISRSLLQKAVRRGSLDVTRLVIKKIIQNDDFDWLRKRLAVVTFEDCWTYGLEVSYDKDEETVIKHYLRITGAVKNKDAAGLGSLAYALTQGDTSVFLGNHEDKAIRIVAEAIKRPNDFWEWTKKQTTSELQSMLVEKADKGFRKAGWPWDRAFTQAAAYLAVSSCIPETHYIEPISIDSFPFWVGIDKHTKEGKKAIREAAKQVGFNANKALWLAFYFESATCNALNYSPWWQKEIDWRMKKLQLSINDAKMGWENIRRVVIELLKDQAEKLKEDIYKIYLSEPKTHITQMSIF